MKGLLDKAKFYEALKPFAKTHTGIDFNIRFGDHYELIFSWRDTKPNGDLDPIMHVQLMDTKIDGFRKYVVPDLVLDAEKEGVDTDYKLYKRLNQWATEAIAMRDKNQGVRA